VRPSWICCPAAGALQLGDQPHALAVGGPPGHGESRFGPEVSDSLPGVLTSGEPRASGRRFLSFPPRIFVPGAFAWLMSEHHAVHALWTSVDKSGSRCPAPAGRRQPGPVGIMRLRLDTQRRHDRIGIGLRLSAQFYPTLRTGAAARNACQTGY